MEEKSRFQHVGYERGWGGAGEEVANVAGLSALFYLLLKSNLHKFWWMQIEYFSGKSASLNRMEGREGGEAGIE